MVTQYSVVNEHVTNITMPMVKKHLLRFPRKSEVFALEFIENIEQILLGNDIDQRMMTK